MSVHETLDTACTRKLVRNVMSRISELRAKVSSTRQYDGDSEALGVVSGEAGTGFLGTSSRRHACDREGMWRNDLAKHGEIHGAAREVLRRRPQGLPSTLVGFPTQGSSALAAVVPAVICGQAPSTRGATRRAASSGSGHWRVLGLQYDKPQ
ncbi:MAG: hypothetical protein R3B96_04830 [Pirellulaceae bacterium]